MLTTMYRQQDGTHLVICGHLNKQEIASHKSDGWRLDKPYVNKNGIRVDHVGRGKRNG